MNRLFKHVWSRALGRLIVVAECMPGSRGRKATRRARIAPGVAATLLAVLPVSAQELPTGGEVVSGAAAINRSGSTLTIDQSSQNMIANWQSFSIGDAGTVTFNQPNASATALNRVIGQDPSHILGNLNANGQVFLINPNGMVFGQDAQVQTGAFVGSTLDIANEDFLSGNYRFQGEAGEITNAGAIEGAVVALVSPRVTNNGTISGDTALAAGTDVMLDFDGDGLVSVEVAGSTVETLVENNGIVQADGGTAILTARGASEALSGVVNNTGTVQARTLAEKGGRILLLGDMEHGTTHVSGTLDASAPDQGDGGFIETSAARVKVADDAVVTTKAANGQTGTWLIDPKDYTIAASGGDMTGDALSTALANNHMHIESVSGAEDGSGDILVNDSITWSDNLLTLTADRDIVFNAELFGSGTAGLALEYGQGDIAAGNNAEFDVNAPVNLAATGSFSTKRGSDGATTTYTIITDLGTASSSGDGTLQGMRGTNGHYVLGADIDASPTNTWNADAGFTPIGDISSGFVGTFDGLGHEIDALYIYRPGDSYVGLFGYADAGVTIRNVGLTDVDFTAKENVGGILGYASTQGVFDNLWSSGRIASSSGYAGGLIGAISAYGGQILLRDGVSSAHVSGTYNVGGILGYLSASGSNVLMDRLQATGRATATSGYGGGLLGSGTAYSGASITLRNSYSMAAVDGGTGNQGGLAGNVYAHDGTFDILSSYVAGPVSGDASYAQSAMVGYFSAYKGTARILSSFWDSEATGKSNFGGYVSVQGSGGGSVEVDAQALTTAEAKDPFTFIGAGWDFDSVWGKSISSENDGYMMLHGQAGTLYDGYLGIFGDLRRDYGDANPDLSDAVLFAGSVDVEWNAAINALTSAGTYALTDPGTLTKTEQGNVYSDIANAGNLIIDKAALTVTANNDSKTYDGAAYSGNNGLTYSGFKNNEDTGVFTGGSTSFGGDADGAVNAGTYTIDLSGDLAADNYVFSYVDGTLTVNKAALTVTANNDAKTYDGLAYAGGNGVSYSGFVNGESASVLGGALNFGGSAQGAVNAGSYDLSASGLTSGNYDISYVDGALTVNKAALTVTARNDAKTYNGVAYSGGNGVSYSGFVNGESASVLGGDLSFGGSAQGAVNAGSYGLSADGLTSGNYDISYVDGALTVNKAALTVTARNDAKTYNGVAYSGGNGVSYSGFVNGENESVLGGALSFGGSAQGAVNAGSYGLSADGLTSGNYDISYVDGALTVNKAALSVTAKNDSKTYDGVAYSGGNGVTYSGFVNGEDESVLGGALSFGGSAQGAVNAGSYGLSADGLTSGNYDISYVDGALTVNKAALSVAANSDTKTYDGVAYAGGNGVSYSGFVNGESASVLGGDLSFGGSAQGAVNAGSYGLSAEGLSSGNYDISYVDGTLTVNRAQISAITNVTAESKPYDGDTLTALDISNAVFNGIVPGDTLAVGGTPTGNFTDPNPGSGKTVRIAGLALAGADAGNYTLLDTTATATADITGGQQDNGGGAQMTASAPALTPSPELPKPIVIVMSAAPQVATSGHSLTSSLDRPGNRALSVTLTLDGDKLIVVLPENADPSDLGGAGGWLALAEEAFGAEAKGISSIQVVVGAARDAIASTN